MSYSVTLAGYTFTDTAFAALGHTDVVTLPGPGTSYPMFQAIHVAGLYDIANNVSLSQNWATQTGSPVNVEYSAKEYAVGTTAPAGSSKNWATLAGAYVTGTSLSAYEWATGTYKRGVAGYGSAKDWATLTGATADNAEYSSKEYAQGTTVSTGSSKSWATITGTTVAGGEYSSKEYAQGTTVSTGSSKNWAQLTGAYVTGALVSAKEWAVGTYKRGVSGFGSAKDWATLTGATADDTEYSAKEYAQGTTVSTGSSKNWAQLSSAYVTGTSLSAYEWAVGIYKRGVAGFGSAKDWATYLGGTVDGTSYSAQYYANQAAAYVSGLSASQTSGSVVIGTGAKTLTIQANKGFATGQYVQCISAGTPTNLMYAQVTSYSGSSLVLNVLYTGGSGTISDFAVFLSGLQGPTGASGSNTIMQGGAAGGTANALTVSTQASISTALRGHHVTLTTGASDSAYGTATLAVDSSSAAQIKMNGSTTLPQAALPKNTTLSFDFDGTYWNLAGGAGASAGGYGAVFAF